MKIHELDKLLLIKAEELSFKAFYTAVSETTFQDKVKAKNLILDLSKYTDLNLSDILSFQEWSDQHTASKCSFVLVNDAINHNDLPQDLHVTPTLQEAKDLVEMEEIERDLGF